MQFFCSVNQLTHAGLRYRGKWKPDDRYPITTHPVLLIPMVMLPAPHLSLERGAVTDSEWRVGEWVND